MTNCTNKWPTDEMVVRGAEEVFDCMRQHDIELMSLTGVETEQYIAESVFLAMLDAAPEPPTVKDSITVEPVGWQYYQDGKWWHGDDRIKDHRKNTEEAGFPVRDVYAAPQPSEQLTPDVSALVEALRVLVDNGGIGPESMFDDARAALAAYRKGGDV